MSSGGGDGRSLEMSLSPLGCVTELGHAAMIAYCRHGLVSRSEDGAVACGGLRVGGKGAVGSKGYSGNVAIQRYAMRVQHYHFVIATAWRDEIVGEHEACGF